MRKSNWRFGVLILAGALLFGACNYLKVAQAPDDKAIVSEIQAKLFQDAVLKTRDIRVVSEKGVVVLTGTVSTELEKAAAERLAGQASGVKQVISQVTVSAASQATPGGPVEQAAATPPAATAPAAAATRAPAKPARAGTRASAPRETAEAAPPTEAAPPATRAEAVSAPAPAEPPVRQPEHITIPSGTVVTVRMIDGIDSSRNRPGEEFAATVDSPVVVEDRVVIPRGSDARVRLVQATSAGHMTGRSELQLELVGLAVGGNTYAVESGKYTQRGASRGTRTAETVGGGAALGGLIGAIAGKGKGAAIGAAVGAGAGTAVQASTRGQQVKVAPETKLDFTLKVPFTVIR